jgi:hypothetical protein
MSKNKMTNMIYKGVFLINNKMCRNFTYEVVGQRRRLKAIKKIVPQKLNVILFFDRIF